MSRTRFMFTSDGLNVAVHVGGDGEVEVLVSVMGSEFVKWEVLDEGTPRILAKELREAFGRFFECAMVKGVGPK